MDFDDDFFSENGGEATQVERAAGDVPLETLAEGSNRRRTSVKNRTQERRTKKKLSRIISQASMEKPHHRDKVMHSLKTFTRAIMGLASTTKPEELPTSASADKQASWANWRERRKEDIKKRLQEIS
ncbi:uncharacterized protein VP01_3367g6 [Puccinia sorghi]|uniref:Uncharacterized protein n=1 Tax=Puccinia sorghi TaxID=27349 RepID=A0A0L6UWZ6_9BASI|nr:uncharacterized protein VP01_3367g6 [Puccinia sorghi]